MPMLSSFDINGSGAGAQLVVLFDVKYQYYARLRSAALSQVSSDFFECVLHDLFGAIASKTYVFQAWCTVGIPYLSLFECTVHHTWATECLSIGEQ